MANMKFVLLQLALIAVLTSAKPNCYPCQYPNGNGLYYNQPQMQHLMQPMNMQQPLAMPQPMMMPQPMPIPQLGPQPVSFSQSAPMIQHIPSSFSMGTPHQPQVSQSIIAQRPVSAPVPQMQPISASGPQSQLIIRNGQNSAPLSSNLNASPVPFSLQRQQYVLPNYPFNFPGGGLSSTVDCAHNK